MMRMPISYRIRRSWNFCSGSSDRHGSNCCFVYCPKPPMAEHRRKVALVDEYNLPPQDHVPHLSDNFFTLALLIVDSIFRPWRAFVPLVSLGIMNGLPMLSPGCDLFTGSWVYDETYPLYTNCSFAEQGFRCAENGRADLQYRNWRWQPRDCNMPRFNARDMLTRLKNKRLAFIGDSMGRTQWESLVCLLMAGAPDKTLVKETEGGVITKTAPYLAVRFPGVNVTVEYYRSPWLVQLGRPPRRSPKRAVATLKLDQLESASNQWQRADVLVFNTGHWWTTTKTYHSGCYFQMGSSIRLGMKMKEAYRIAVATWAAWVNERLNPDVTQVFFEALNPATGTENLA